MRILSCGKVEQTSRPLEQPTSPQTNRRSTVEKNSYLKFETASSFSTL